SEHHLARAVVEAAQTRSIEIPHATDFHAYPGEGVEAMVDSRNVWAGNATMAERHGARLGALLLGWTAEQTSRGRSVIYLGIDNQPHGALSFGDSLKPGVAASVRHLKYEG